MNELYIGLFNGLFDCFYLMVCLAMFSHGFNELSIVRSSKLPSASDAL